MSDSASTRHTVDLEDAQRLNRLSEEIRGRLTEIALIITRITGTAYHGGPVLRFVPREAVAVDTTTAADTPPSDWLEVVEILPGLVCCYGSIGGHTVLECPCGSG